MRRFTPVSALAVSALLSLAACAEPERADQTAPPPAAAEPERRSALNFLDAPAAGPRDRVIAEVGGTPIRLSDVRREARAKGRPEDAEPLQPGEPDFEAIAEELIEHRLLALEARRRGLHRSDEARRRLAAAEERILSNILVETEVASTVTDEAVERVYENQSRLAPPVQETRASHILVTTRAEAEQAVRLVREEGQDFAALARRISQDPGSRAQGGDLGWFARDGVIPEIAQAAFSLEPGEVSDPVRTRYGWHVVRVDARRSQPRQGLEELRPDIVRFLTLEGIEALLEGVRETFPVEIQDADAPRDLRGREGPQAGEDFAPPPFIAAPPGDREAEAEPSPGR